MWSVRTAGMTGRFLVTVVDRNLILHLLVPIISVLPVIHSSFIVVIEGKSTAGMRNQNGYNVHLHKHSKMIPHRFCALLL